MKIRNLILLLLGLFSLMIARGERINVLPKVDESPEERERGIKLIGGDLSMATNETERFYALESWKEQLRAGKIPDHPKWR
jgi:hypothetical protein